MVSELDSGPSGPCSSPGRGRCVVSLGKTLYSHSASLHPGVLMGTGDQMLGVTCDGQASHPAILNRDSNILLVASCYRNRDKLRQLWATRLVKTLPLFILRKKTVIL